MHQDTLTDALDRFDAMHRRAEREERLAQIEDWALPLGIGMVIGAAIMLVLFAWQPQARAAEAVFNAPVCPTVAC
ncbi:hypothetical protein [Tranquillimonas rosea]|uniref:hypothetical protein n=1 Tax=Tranquillimonas rosea TaxID=641238 RepID=UPI003BAA0250